MIGLNSIGNIELHVVGRPTPQGSKTAIPGKDGGRPFLIPAGSTSHKRAALHWRKAVKAEAELWLLQNGSPEPLDEPLFVSITFLFERPSSDKYRTRHSTKPDVDKLVRSVLDSLTNSKIIRDDSRVSELSARKVYVYEDIGAPWDREGAVIEIHRLGEQECNDRERLKAHAKENRLKLKS